MKKILLRVLTVLLSVIVITGSMASCGLFEVDTDRDMAQVVATVDIGDGVNAEDIYKRDLISGFMSYGYMYVQSYGYSVADTYELILDNLINNRIILQNARVKLASGSEKTASDLDSVLNEFYNEEDGVYTLALFATQKEVNEFAAKNNASFGSEAYIKALAKFVYDKYVGKTLTADDAPFRFVDADFLWKAVADTKDSVSSLIESFMDDEEEHEHEDVSYTIRTTPTMDDEEDEEITAEELAKYKAKEIKLSTNKHVNALDEAYSRFVTLGLVDSGEKFNASIKDNVAMRDLSVMNLSYFKSALIGTCETKLIELYEDVLREEKKLTETDAEELWASYTQLKNSQKEEFGGSVTSLETSLGAVSESSFVAYVPGTGYAYVSHLLVKYDSELKADLDEEISNWKNNYTDGGKGAITIAKKAEFVDIYAQKIVATDLRSSWVQAGYGVNKNGVIEFTDDYVYTDAFRTFDGTVEKITVHTEEDEDGNEVMHFNYYGVTGNEIDFAAFNEKVNTAIGASVTYGVAGQVEYNVDLFERFEDLKFAYSSDEGNFNNYFGYLYSPVTSKTDYVSAFADAAKEVTAMGAGAYMMFGSYEYGLHVVLCTKVVTDLVYDDIVAFTADLTVEDSVAYNFLKATNDLLESNYIGKLAEKFVQDGKKTEGVVTKYEKTYEDLVK